MDMLVGLVLLILIFAVIGFLAYIVVKNVPMLEPFKQAIGVVCVAGLVLYLLMVATGHAPWPTLPGGVTR